MKKAENKIIAKIFILSFLLVVSFSVIQSAFAADALVPCGVGVDAEGKGKADCTLCHLVIGFKNIYDYFFTILLAATTLVVVVAGVMYMVSSGDKGMIDKAKSALTYALTAMVLALTAWLIINATLTALGYTKVDNWYTFTCDTTQTKGATGGAGTGTTTTTGTTTGTATTGTGCAAVANNAKSMIGFNYSQSNRNGASSADCSSVAERSYKAAGCKSPGSGSEGIYANAKTLNAGSLKAGDLIVYRKSTGGANNHVATCLDDGCTTVIGASGDSRDTVGVGSGIYKKSSTYDLGQSGARMISASDYCSGAGC